MCKSQKWTLNSGWKEYTKATKTLRNMKEGQQNLQIESGLHIFGLFNTGSL